MLRRTDQGKHYALRLIVSIVIPLIWQCTRAAAAAAATTYPPQPPGSSVTESDFISPDEILIRIDPLLRGNDAVNDASTEEFTLPVINYQPRPQAQQQEQAINPIPISFLRFDTPRKVDRFSFIGGPTDAITEDFYDPARCVLLYSNEDLLESLRVRLERSGEAMLFEDVLNHGLFDRVTSYSSIIPRGFEYVGSAPGELERGQEHEQEQQQEQQDRLWTGILCEFYGLASFRRLIWGWDDAWDEFG